MKKQFQNIVQDKNFDISAAFNVVFFMVFIAFILGAAVAMFPRDLLSNISQIQLLFFLLLCSSQIDRKQKKCCSLCNALLLQLLAKILSIKTEYLQIIDCKKVTILHTVKQAFENQKVAHFCCSNRRQMKIWLDGVYVESYLILGKTTAAM